MANRANDGKNFAKENVATHFYDEAFAHIAQRAGNVHLLLDEFFSFLHRRTDFYVQFPPNSLDSNGDPIKYKMGFPEGLAEEMVLRAFRQYPMKDYEQLENQYSASPSPPNGKPPVPPTTTKPISNISKASGEASTSQKGNYIQYTAEGKQIPIGNGGIGPNYYWTQSLRETTIYVDISSSVINSKAVNCNIKISSISLSVNGSTVLAGDLEDTIRPSESTWTLNKGSSSESSQIIITLEKTRETWWKHVIVGHPEIDTAKVTYLLPTT
jgi:hypothetical protein